MIITQAHQNQLKSSVRITMQKTKICIIGADPSAFHIFQTLYRSDDRYDVVSFVNVKVNGYEKLNLTSYPRDLAGPAYPGGIKIVGVSPFSDFLSYNQIERCIFSPFCVTSSIYLYLAAQCMAAESSVVTHSLESTRLQPPNAFVSYFADTKFDIPILMQILKVYKENKIKPAVAIPSPPTLLSNDKNRTPNFMFLNIQSMKDLKNIEFGLGDHMSLMCQQIIQNNFEIYFVNDFEVFSREAVNINSFDLIVFVGFNSLPCYFESHLVVFACDDFTFCENLAEHPSYILLQQADVVLCADIQSGGKCPQKLQDACPGKVVSLCVSFSGKNQEMYRNRKCLLIDDGYPTHICNAAKSISYYLANHFSITPVTIKQNKAQEVSDSPIYSEPSERHWPALIMPDNQSDWTHICESDINSNSEFDLILSSTFSPIPTAPLKIERVLQFVFKIDLSQINLDLLSLPPGAFIRQRRR